MVARRRYPCRSCAVIANFDHRRCAVLGPEDLREPLCEIFETWLDCAWKEYPEHDCFFLCSVSSPYHGLSHRDGDAVMICLVEFTVRLCGGETGVMVKRRKGDFEFLIEGGRVPWLRRNQ